MGIDVGHACSLQGSRGACVALAWAQYKHYLAFSRRMSRLNASSALSFWRRASILAAAFILAFSAKERSAAVLMKFYLIEEGECIAQIKDEKSGEQVTVGELKAGDYFGEKALISGEPRAATIVATTDVKLAAMDVAAFERVMGSRRASMERRMSEYKSVDDAKSAAE